MPISTWTMLNLPDTGQTESYTTTFGEDSDYTINPPSYMDNGDGTVTDANTGLMWQQGEAGSMNWEDAITCCEGLSLAGYTDWRLPNIKELESITDDSLYNPPIDTNYFPEAHTSHYWSSTIFAAGPPYAWRLRFVYGCVDNNDKSLTYYVRCVRAGQ